MYNKKTLLKFTKYNNNV